MFTLNRKMLVLAMGLLPCYLCSDFSEDDKKFLKSYAERDNRKGPFYVEMKRDSEPDSKFRKRAVFIKCWVDGLIRVKDPDGHVYNTKGKMEFFAAGKRTPAEVFSMRNSPIHAFTNCSDIEWEGSILWMGGTPSCTISNLDTQGKRVPVTISLRGKAVYDNISSHIKAWSNQNERSFHLSPGRAQLFLEPEFTGLYNIKDQNRLTLIKKDHDKKHKCSDRLWYKHKDILYEIYWKGHKPRHKGDKFVVETYKFKEKTTSQKWTDCKGWEFFYIDNIWSIDQNKETNLSFCSSSTDIGDVMFDNFCKLVQEDAPDKSVKQFHLTLEGGDNKHRTFEVKKLGDNNGLLIKQRQEGQLEATYRWLFIAADKCHSSKTKTLDGIFIRNVEENDGSSRTRKDIHLRTCGDRDTEAFARQQVSAFYEELARAEKEVSDALGKAQS